MVTTLKDNWILVSIHGETKKVIYYDDIKDKLLEFDELLKNEIIMSMFDLSQSERQKRIKKLRKQFKEIFGDFKK